LKLFRDLGAKPGFSPRVGHTLLANLIASGEIPFSLTIYSDAVEELKKAGAPIETLYLAPVIGMHNAAAVMKDAPHPYAAVLFLDFLLSDAQEILAKRDIWPTNPKAKPLPAGVTLKFLNPAKILDEDEKWTRLHREIIGTRAR